MSDEPRKNLILSKLSDTTIIVSLATAFFFIAAYICKAGFLHSFSIPLAYMDTSIQGLTEVIIIVGPTFLVYAGLTFVHANMHMQHYANPKSKNKEKGIFSVNAFAGVFFILTVLIITGPYAYYFWHLNEHARYIVMLIYLIIAVGVFLLDKVLSPEASDNYPYINVMKINNVFGVILILGVFLTSFYGWGLAYSMFKKDYLVDVNNPQRFLITTHEGKAVFVNYSENGTNNHVIELVDYKDIQLKPRRKRYLPLGVSAQ